MGTKHKIGVLFFLFLSCQLLAQEEEAILWRAAHRLTWNDFRAEPPVSDRVAATTASGISYRFSSIERNGEMEIDFEVSTYFYPDKSWYKPEICNAVILSHEQLHFDISELFARKMRKIISGRRFTKNIKAEVKEIYRQINEELAAFQNRYDTETNYSRNVEQQLLWNEVIKEALEF